MHIAILGATSQLARDFVSGAQVYCQFSLFARRPQPLTVWVNEMGLSSLVTISDYESFGQAEYNAIINFVGIGDPAKAASMGKEIFGVTRQYDDLAIDYLLSHPACRYLFLSSGAAYGNAFESPVTESTPASWDLNNPDPRSWYGLAKFAAEMRHRAAADMQILDIRIFNYFSRTQDLSARFFVTDMLRALRDGVEFEVSQDPMVRDYLHPQDFVRLVMALLDSPPANDVVDAYSRAPVDKDTLLQEMQNLYGLRYRYTQQTQLVNATGRKPHYYSLNRRAEKFGYQPKLTSLEGLTIEFEQILKS